MHEVNVPPRVAQRLRSIAGADVGHRYEQQLADARRALGGRTVWHINSTAEGGGVAELLRSCLGYLAEDGITARWLVIEGDPTFFAITKRIHNRLHGVLGDGGPLAEAERRHYDQVMRDNLAAADRYVRAGDIVVVHDPQPLGMAPALRSMGATVIWTCHVGVDTPNDIVRSAWEFLLADAREAQTLTFTRAAYAWDGLDAGRVRLIPPCIDGLSPKNVELDPPRRRSILAAAGLVTSSGENVAPTFERSDGTEATVTHVAEMIEEAPVPTGAPLVVQVSRWDALKDPAGVVRGFVEEPGLADAHLILAGPADHSVADDPEATNTLREVRDLRRGLPVAERRRVHLANLPTGDVEENASIVNALQRHADVIVQKSLAEGFGLTVTEAMWKARPIVAADVGGIRDQIDDGVQGALVDPRDLTAFGTAVLRLLHDRTLADQLGQAARRRVRERYLAPQYLGAYLELFSELL